MKAVAVFPEQKKVAMIDQPEPEIGRPSEVKIRVLETGICGTDRGLCSYFWGRPPAGEDHLILGHESFGEVVSVGPGVERLKAGDLVSYMVRRPCEDPYCQACRAGRPDFCFTGGYTERGILAAHGCLTPFIVDEEAYLQAVPAELRDVGVFVEPLTIVEKAVMEAEKIMARYPWYAGKGDGLTAVVVGAGPIGLFAAMLLRCKSFRTFVYSRSPAPNPKAAIAERIGVTYVSSQTHTPEQLREETGRIDLVIEAAGARDLSFRMMEVLGPNGVFVFTAGTGNVPPASASEFVMRHMVGLNKVFFGTVNASPESFPAAVRDLGTFQRLWPGALQGLITSRHPLEAYPDLMRQGNRGIKEVIVLA